VDLEQTGKNQTAENITLLSSPKRIFTQTVKLPETWFCVVLSLLAITFSYWAQTYLTGNIESANYVIWFAQILAVICFIILAVLWSFMFRGSTILVQSCCGMMTICMAGIVMATMIRDFKTIWISAGAAQIIWLGIVSVMSKYDALAREQKQFTRSLEQEAGLIFGKWYIWIARGCRQIACISLFMLFTISGWLLLLAAPIFFKNPDLVPSAAHILARTIPVTFFVMCGVGFFYFLITITYSLFISMIPISRHDVFKVIVLNPLNCLIGFEVLLISLGLIQSGHWEWLLIIIASWAALCLFFYLTVRKAAARAEGIDITSRFITNCSFESQTAQAYFKRHFGRTMLIDDKGIEIRELLEKVFYPWEQIKHIAFGVGTRRIRNIMLITQDGIEDFGRLAANSVTGYAPFKVADIRKIWRERIGNKEGTRFEYPESLRERDRVRHISERKGAIGMGCMMFALSLLFLFMPAKPNELYIKIFAVGTSWIVAAVLLLTTKFSKPKEILRYVELQDESIKFVYEGDKEEQFTLSDVRKVKVWPNQSFEVYFKNGIRKYELERLSYWPVLLEKLQQRN
jgi:hypothetical protein